jgi:hypothetical protein
MSEIPAVQRIHQGSEKLSTSYLPRKRGRTIDIQPKDAAFQRQKQKDERTSKTFPEVLVIGKIAVESNKKDNYNKTPYQAPEYLLQTHQQKL